MSWDIRTDQPKVSVCVPTYNHGNFIETCLDSILAQETTFPFEICVGEDESSDGTREICERYAEKHPDKIRLFLRSRRDVVLINGRPTGRYNFVKTLEACRGRYIALCEGDDYWLDPRKLQIQVDALEANPDCSECFCNVHVDYGGAREGHDGYGVQEGHDESREVQVLSKPAEKTTAVQLARGNFIHTPGAVFRNWLLEHPMPSFIMETEFADWPLHLLNAERGDLLYIDQVLAGYRVQAGGLWSRTSVYSKISLSLRTACRMLGAYPFEENVKTEMRAAVKAWFRQVWKMVPAGTVDDFSMEWFSGLVDKDPFVRKIRGRYIRRYRFLCCCRYFERMLPGICKR